MLWLLGGECLLYVCWFGCWFMSSSSAGFAVVCDFVNCVLVLFACFGVIGFNSVVIFNSLLIRVGGVSDLLGLLLGGVFLRVVCL